MDPQALKARLRGVLAFVPTPFTADDRVDLDGLARQVDTVCRGGAHAVVVCGGVGEFYALDLDEYRACIRTAADAAQGRLPVLAGIGHSSKIAAQLAAYAESVGADGLMINPLYFVEPSDSGMVLHYQTIAQASRLGMIVFSTRGSEYAPALLERLAEIDSVIGFKDEVGDLKLFAECVERLGERLVWINGMAETLAVPYFAAGAQAFTSGIVNFAPRLSLDVWDAGVAGDFVRLRQCVAATRPLARLRARRPGYMVAVLKEAMNLLSLPGGALRAPLQPMAPADQEELRGMLERLNLLPARVSNR